MILTFDHESVRELRLNRPPVNALSTELLSSLRRAVQQAPQEGTRAIVISGAPGRFSAGLDLPLLLSLGEPEMKVLWGELYGTMRTIAISPVPTVAAITGHAPAGGTVLSLFCDWRVMADGDFKLGLNEVQVGISLPPIILQGLQRLVGIHHAEYLGVSGALISPAEALRVGLVDELAPAEQVIDRAIAWCKGMLALPPNAMTSTRQEARKDLGTLFASNLDRELERVLAGWWHPETQSTLRAIAAQLGKKKAAS